MVAIGHLVGYGVGTVKLMSIFGTLLGNSQLKQMSVIAAFGLMSAVGITSYAVTERVLISPRYRLSSDIIDTSNLTKARESDTTSGIINMLTKIYKTTMHLPNRIQAICWVQFWAWIGEYSPPDSRDSY